MRHRKLIGAFKKMLRSGLLPGALIVVGMLACAPQAAHAALPGSMLAEPASGWGWWLPPNYSTHGDSMDVIFYWIFWITSIVMVLVEGVLIYFLIKYRDRRNGRRATYIHGNNRLEMAWTLIPAVIFAAIALTSKGVWDKYRYAEKEPNRAEILVIAQQFAWNVVYPGPDNTLGDYLVFPQPTDPLYRKYNYEDAIQKINAYVADNGENPLGLDLTGSNSDYALENDYVKVSKSGGHPIFYKQPGRAIIVPGNRQTRIWLSSKDVIHDFYLPNFRVKLDAVPGMKGAIDLKTKPEAESTQTLPIGDERLLGKVAWISPSSTKWPANLPYDKDRRNYYLPDPANPSKVLLGSLQPIDKDTIIALHDAGYKELTAVVKPYEVVCEELCGMGHATMRAEFYVVSQAEYEDFNNRIDKNEISVRPTSRPSSVVLAR